MKRAILIFGNAQHGKDSLADAILAAAERAGLPARKLRFADPVKNVAIEMLGMPREVAYGDGVSTARREELRREWVVYGRNAREWLQWIGTELGREQISQTLWADTLVRKIEHGPSALTVVPDGRFYTELDSAARLRAAGIPTLVARIRRLGAPVDASHPSEAEQLTMADDLFDVVVTNDGTLADLDQAADAIIGRLLEQETVGGEAPSITSDR